jgi:type I restriction enzyme S subunit
MNWQRKKLGEICEENISGDWGVEEEKINSILCKIIRGTDFLSVQKGELSNLPERYIDIDKFEKLKLNTGDILIEISGGSKDQPTGRILFWDIKVDLPIVFSNFVKKILLKTKIVEPKYFFRYWQFLYLKGITKNYEERTTNIRNFKLKKFLENEKIPLPPLPVQQKIVKILDTIQSAVEVQGKIIEKTKELKKALINLLFHYGLAGLRIKELAGLRVDELTSSEIKKFGLKLKKTEIGEIPEHWEVVRLGDKKLFELIMGQSPPSISYNQNKKGLPFLQGKAEFGEIYPQPIKWCDKPIKVAEKNDVLISVRAPVGDLNLADQKYCIGRGLASIRLKNNVNPFFLFNCLNFFKNQILTYGTGSTFKAITKEILENFKIPLPPLSEQKEIAEILQTIDQKIEIEKKKKELYYELFKTLLNKIMNQEIEVDLLDY